MLSLEKMERRCLRLKKTLYGLRQSPRMFWKYLTKAVNAVGMKTSAFGPCMFIGIGDRITPVTSVDNILFWSTNEKYVNNFGMKLREQGLFLEEEDNAAGFLGVTMDRNEDGSIELKQ